MRTVSSVRDYRYHDDDDGDDSKSRAFCATRGKRGFLKRVAPAPAACEMYAFINWAKADAQNRHIYATRPVQLNACNAVLQDTTAAVLRIILSNSWHTPSTANAERPTGWVPITLNIFYAHYRLCVEACHMYTHTVLEISLRVQQIKSHARCRRRRRYCNALRTHVDHDVKRTPPFSHTRDKWRSPSGRLELEILRVCLVLTHSNCSVVVQNHLWKCHSLSKANTPTRVSHQYND